MAQEELQSICLFLASGHTFTFRNVTILHDNETVIVFTYTAMPDGEKKEGVFYKTLVAGVGKLR